MGDVLKVLAIIIYREACCERWTEDCEELEELARERFGIDLAEECEEGGQR